MVVGAGLWWLFHALYVRPYIRRNGITVTGREHLPPAGPAILAVYPHRSALEPAIIQALYPLRALSQVVPTGSDEFFRRQGKLVYLTARHVIGVSFIKQNSGAAAREGSFDPFAHTQRCLRLGKTVIVFPQGTRREGADLKKGLYHLHRGAPAGTPVVPLVLEGTEGLARPGALLPAERHFTVRVLSPLRCTEGLSAAGYVAALQERLAAATARPVAHGGA